MRTVLDNEVSTGTTIIAFEINGGVVIGADSRTTTGAYVANRVANKLTKISDLVYCCRSGSAADTQAISDIVRYHANFHAIELNEPPKVEMVATIFRQYCYRYRESLSAGILIAGWDKYNGGQVFSVPLGGMMIRQKIAVSGSGSVYVIGFLDASYRENMDETAAVELIRKALFLAMSRDGSSGGVARIAIINENGVKHFTFTTNGVLMSGNQ